MATVELKPDDYVLGIWFVGGDGADWLACVKRSAGNEHFTCSYRLRTHVDSRIWDSDDVKSGASIDIPPTETERAMIAKMRGMAASLGQMIDASFGNVSITELLIQGDGTAAVDALMEQEWAHAMRVGGQA